MYYSFILSSSLHNSCMMINSLCCEISRKPINWYLIVTTDALYRSITDARGLSCSLLLGWLVCTPSHRLMWAWQLTMSTTELTGFGWDRAWSGDKPEMHLIGLMMSGSTHAYILPLLFTKKEWTLALSLFSLSLLPPFFFHNTPVP